jgi:acetylornithine/succinyldiaminopimelate/putrescine aminotransferase
MNWKKIFLKHVGQTGPDPFLIEVDHASGVNLYDKSGKHYLDLDAGISVSTLGHCHPAIISAIKEQASKYLHTTVYGEHIQQPQVEYAVELTRILPDQLNTIYFVNSGSEAIEGAMKLCRKVTGRYEIAAFRRAYHGSTTGPESLRSDLEYKMAFQPLVPGVRHLDFNAFDSLREITPETAAVIAEPVRGEAGVELPAPGFLQALRHRCTETGALLVYDEIQTGFGRTGRMFAFEHWKVIPDVLVLAKAMGGGLPLGGFVSSQEHLSVLANHPVQGHITTFGGNPLCCAAGLALLRTLERDDLIRQAEEKATYFASRLQRLPGVEKVRRKGLLMAVQLREGLLHQAISRMTGEGLLVNWFLFNNDSFRISPPLIISKEEMDEAIIRMGKALTGLAS